MEHDKLKAEPRPSFLIKAFPIFPPYSEQKAECLQWPKTTYHLGLCLPPAHLALSPCQLTGFCIPSRQEPSWGPPSPCPLYWEQSSFWHPHGCLHHLSWALAQFLLPSEALVMTWFERTQWHCLATFSGGLDENGPQGSYIEYVTI